MPTSAPGSCEARRVSSVPMSHVRMRHVTMVHATMERATMERARVQRPPSEHGEWKQAAWKHASARAGTRSSQQRGMAVIVAMLVVAIVAVIAAGLILRQSAAMRTLGGEQLRAQLAVSVDAALEHAATQLRDDAREQGATITGGRWSRPIAIGAPLPVTLQLYDAQGAFNLRNLVQEGRPEPAALATLLRLCARQGVGAEECTAISNYVVSRLAEAGAGAGVGPLPLDGFVGTVLPQMEPARAAALERRLVMLPMPTLLNANTTDAALLASAIPAAGDARITALLAERDQGRWLLNTGDIAHRLQLTQEQMYAMQVGIHSEWFIARGQVQAEDRRVDFRALVWREYRDQGVRIQRVWTRIGA